MLILLDEDRFKRIVNNIGMQNQANICIISEENEQIFSMDNTEEKPSKLDYSLLSQADGTLHKKIGDQKMSIISTPSILYPWEYVYFSPIKIAREKAYYIRDITLFSLFLYIIASIFMIIAFSKRNYTPLSNIIHMFKDKSVKNYGNEYNYIINAISKTIDEKENINKKLELNQPILKTDFLNKLIKGKVSTDSPVYDLLSSFGITVNYENFAILLVDIDDYTELFCDEQDDKFIENFKLVQFAICNVIDELANKNDSAFVTQLDDMIACVVNVESDDFSNVKDKLINISKETKKFLEENLKIYTTIAISNINKSIYNLSESYNQAIEVMQYRMVVGNSEILCYEDIKISDKTHTYSLGTEQAFVNCIKMGDIDGAKNVIEDMFKSGMGNGFMSIEMTKCFMFGIVNTMIKAMDEISVVCDNEFLSDIGAVQALLQCTTINDLKSQIVLIIENVCSYILLVKKRNKNDTLKNDVVNYITKNYHDMTICISTVADEFDVNSAFLSKFFKEQMGESILDYINKLRIQEAKSMICNGYSIGDTGNTVGYVNSNTFIRAFKKYEGITPGKYREIMEQAQ